ARRNTWAPGATLLQLIASPSTGWPGDTPTRGPRRPIDHRSGSQRLRCSFVCPCGSCGLLFGGRSRTIQALLLGHSETSRRPPRLVGVAITKGCHESLSFCYL